MPIAIENLLSLKLSLGMAPVTWQGNIAKPMIVTDPGVMAAGWTDQVAQTLIAYDIAHITFSQVTSNPREEEAMMGAAAYMEAGCDGIIAVGGGSPMDCAKGIGIVVSNGGHRLDYEGVDQILGLDARGYNQEELKAALFKKIRSLRYQLGISKSLGQVHATLFSDLISKEINVPSCSGNSPHPAMVIELLQINKDGTTTWIEAKVSCFCSDDGSEKQILDKIDESHPLFKKIFAISHAGERAESLDKQQQKRVKKTDHH